MKEKRNLHPVEQQRSSVIPFSQQDFNQLTDLSRALSSLTRLCIDGGDRADVGYILQPITDRLAKFPAEIEDRFVRRIE